MGLGHGRKYRGSVDKIVKVRASGELEGRFDPSRVALQNGELSLFPSFERVHRFGLGGAGIALTRSQQHKIDVSRIRTFLDIFRLASFSKI